MHQFLFLSVQFLGRIKTSLSTSVFKSMASKVIYLWKGYFKILVGFLKEFKCMWKTHPEVSFNLKKKKKISKHSKAPNERAQSSRASHLLTLALKRPFQKEFPKLGAAPSESYFNTNITSCSDCWGVSMKSKLLRGRDFKFGTDLALSSPLS